MPIIEPMPTLWDVFRRLPSGNDCWARQNEKVEADTDDEAIDKCVQDWPDDWFPVLAFAIPALNTDDVAVVHRTRPERPAAVHHYSRAVYSEPDKTFVV